MDIDNYHENTPDKAEYKGHFYSDKAPGVVILAVPAFTLGTVGLVVIGESVDSYYGWLFSSWVACTGSIGIITALGAAALFAWLSRYVCSKWALVTTLALFLGAAPLPYATMMFSHALVVGLIAIALWATAKQGECVLRTAEWEVAWEPLRRPHPPFTGGSGKIRERVSVSRWDLVAGFASGWVCASEFTAGVVITGILFWVMSEDWRRAIPFCLAAIPPVLLIPLYSWLCFGTPFILPYSLNASFPEMRQGFYSIKWPDELTAYNLLFRPTRGLFFWTPFLFMAGVGYLKLLKTNRRLFWLSCGIPLLHIIVISGRTWDWTAGPSLGPRYLAPILPLMAIPCAVGVQRFHRLGIAVAAYSILITTLATLVNACPPAQLYNPLLELHIPELLKGEIAPNLGTVFGLPAGLSVILFYTLLIAGIVWLWREARGQELKGVTGRALTSAPRTGRPGQLVPPSRPCEGP